MVRRLRFFICVLVLLSCSAVNASNILTDWSFETFSGFSAGDGINSVNTTKDDWKLRSTGGAGAVFSAVSPGQDGDTAIRVTRTSSAGDAYISRYRKPLHRYLQDTPYRFRVWARSYNSSSMQISIGSYGYYSSTTPIAEDSRICTLTPEWRLYEVAHLTNPSTYSLDVVVHPLGAGSSIEIDNVSLESSPPSSVSSIDEWMRIHPPITAITPPANGVLDTQWMDLGNTSVTTDSPATLSAAAQSGLERQYELYADQLPLADVQLNVTTNTSYIYDESFVLARNPSASNLQSVADSRDWLAQNRPYALKSVITNSSDPAYLHSLLAIVRPDVLVYEIYPLLNANVDLTSYMVKLHDVQRIAAGYNVPALVSVQDFSSSDGIYRAPSGPEMFLQAYVPLTMGYKGVMYNPYTSDSQWTGLLNLSGQPGPLYPWVQDVNADINPVLRPLSFAWLERLLWIPADGLSAPAGFNVWPDSVDPAQKILGLSIASDSSLGAGQNGLIGFYRDDGRHQLVLLTNLYDDTTSGTWAAHDFTILFDSSVSYILLINPDNPSSWEQYIPVDANGRVTLSIPAGSSVLFSYYGLGNRPVEGKMIINNAETFTTSRDVTLHLRAGDDIPYNDVQMSFMNDDSGSTQYTVDEPFARTKPWTLSSGDGKKTVNCKLSGSVITTSVVLCEHGPAGTVSINQGAELTNSNSVNLAVSVMDPVSTVNAIRFSNDNTNWSSWESFASSKTWTLLSGDGVKSVYVQFRDAVGNISPSCNDDITLDTTPPQNTSVQINSGAKYCTGTIVTMTYSATDAVYRRCSYDGVKWAEWEAFSLSQYTGKYLYLPRVEGLATVYVQYKDLAGNVSDTCSDSIILDFSGPTGSIVINNGDANTSSTAVTLTLSATDITSPVTQMQFSNDNSTWSALEPYATSKAWTLPSGGGDKTVYVRFVDEATNYSVTYSDTITYGNDTIPPTGSVLINNGATVTISSAVTLSLLASDNIGVTDMRLSNDGNTWNAWEAFASTKPWTFPSGDGTRSIFVQYRDQVSNVSPTYSASILVDGTSPLGGIRINNDAWDTDDTTVTLNISSSDSGSGVTQMHFSNDGVTYSAWEAYAATKTWSLLPGDGTRTVYLIVKDAIGNVSLPASDTITLHSIKTPTNLTATAVSDTGIDLAWTDNSNNETAFEVYRRLGTDGAFSKIATVAADTLQYHDTGLTTRQLYFYRVRAVNETSYSIYSNYASTYAYLLPAPTSLAVTSVSANQVNLSWTDNSSDEVSFKIERKTGSSGTWTQIYTTGANVATYQDSGLITGTTYYYRVKAYNGFTESVYSNEVSAIPAVKYIVTPSVGANGTLSPNTAQSVTSGSSLAFTATPNTGYAMGVWSVDGTTVQTGGRTYTLSNITANHTVAVTFIIFTPKITPSAGANGSISPSTAQTVTYGSSLTLTATPNSGYTVNAWSVDGVSVQTGGTTYTLSNIIGSHSVSVTFKTASTYTVTPSVGANGTLSPNTVQSVTSGSSLAFTATPNTGYAMGVWTVDGTTVQTGGRTYTLSNITANHTVAVTFIVFTPKITPSAGANGTISPSTAQTVTYGSSLTLTATPNSGYTVNAWSVDGVSVQTGGTTYTLSNIIGSHSVSVTFKTASTFTVTPSVGANGTLSPNTAQSVTSGSSLAFTATPNTGYAMGVWSVDGTTVQTGGRTYTLSNITANHTVAVTFIVFTPKITPSAGANGKISPSTAQTVTYGSSLTLTATPNSGYTVNAWSVDGVSVQTGGTTYTLSNIIGSHSVSVTFKAASTYTVTPSVGANGTLNPNTAQTVNSGSSLVFSAVPNTGYAMGVWSVDGTTVQTGGRTYTLSNITANHTVAVTFIVFTPKITPSAGANGSISPSTAQTVTYGSSLTLTATPNSGYAVNAWSVDGTSVQTGGTTYTLSNIIGSHTVSVTFKAASNFTVTPSVGANGTLSPNTAQSVTPGSSLAFTATPNTGYAMGVWSVDGTTVQTGGRTYTLSNITANHTVAVTFIVFTPKITPSAGANGKISPSTAQTVTYGSSLTLTATPNSGYTVNAWSVDGVSVQTGGTTYTLSNIIGSHTVSVTFKAASNFTVTPSVGANGTLSPNTAQTVNSGSSLVFSAVPNTGYAMGVWSVDGTTVQTGGRTYTLSNITANHTVAVTFIVFTPKITPSAGANGTISPSTAQTVTYGSSLTLTATPNTGYTVNAWSVDGTSVQTGGTTYTLSNIIGSHTVSVTFK